jgi:hypothetical protein
MTDWSPTGAPYSVSERASASAQLERGYRRLVRAYPRSFRRESTEEVIAVLLATARADQRHPSLLEAADLLRGAARMRLGLSGCPRTVLNAVRLMYLGAVAQVVVLVSVALSASAIQAAARTVAIRSLGPHPAPAAVEQVVVRTSAVTGLNLTAGATVALFGVACWLFLAWASGRGFPLARAGAVISCAFYSLATILTITRGDLTVAPVAMIASCAVTAIGITADILLVLKPSWRYYEPRPVAR